MRVGWYDEPKHCIKLLLANILFADDHLLSRKRLECFLVDVAYIPLFPFSLRRFLPIEEEFRGRLCFHDANRVGLKNFMADHFVCHFPQNVDFVANCSR